MELQSVKSWCRLFSTRVDQRGALLGTSVALAIIVLLLLSYCCFINHIVTVVAAVVVVGAVTLNP